MPRTRRKLPKSTMVFLGQRQSDGIICCEQSALSEKPGAIRFYVEFESGTVSEGMFYQKGPMRQDGPCADN